MAVTVPYKSHAAAAPAWTCTSPRARRVARGFRHRSFCKERKGENGREGKKRGRVLQRQTQSVMQDYSVSSSTAIDVVFMGETQGFSKRSGPCYPCSILETKAEGGGGVEGILSPPTHHPRGLCRLMAAVSIPPLPGGQVGGDLSFHLSAPCTLEVGSLLHRRWERGDLGRLAALLPFLREVAVCVWEAISACPQPLCVCVRADQFASPRVLNRIYSGRAGTSQTLHSMSAPCRKKSPWKI